MVQAIEFFYRIYPNYGVAIILLTGAVKMLLYPLTKQSTQQMRALQKLQPKVKELQEKFKSDPKEQQKRVMELYQQEGANPLGGCLPMLLQLPFFLGLFFAIRDMEFSGSGTSFLWISSLSQPDAGLITVVGLPISILVILIGLATYLAQKTTPQAGQSGASAMLITMPLFIAGISATFPAGVQIYWLVQTAITALQQMYINRAADKA